MRERERERERERKKEVEWHRYMYTIDPKKIAMVLVTIIQFFFT